MSTWLEKIHSSRVGNVLGAPYRYYRAFEQQQTSGDRFILNTLTLIVLASGVFSLYTLQQHFLVEVPAYGGSLTEGVVGSPRFINPLLALSDADRDLTALTYAGLMGVGADGTLLPVLAESYTISEDGKVYTFKIRKDAKFSDGTSVTAEDVVFTVRRAQDPQLKSPELSSWINIQSTVVDARTVQFTLPKPYAPFLIDTTLGILPAHLWREVTTEEFPFSPLMQNPVGAGPFKVEKVVRNKNGIIEKYTLSAFNDYALNRPYIDTITFLFYPQASDLEKALSQGKVESAYAVAETGAASDSKTLRAPYSRVFGVFFNANNNAAFNRTEVRQALSHAINRDAIVSNVLGGFATPLFGPLPPEAGITNTPAPHYENQTARITSAASILEKAGWKYDGEAREWKNAKEKLALTVTLRTSNVPELKSISTAIQKDWNALGVPVTIELYESGDLTQNVIRSRNYSALLFGMVIEREEDLYAFWNSSERNDPGLNISLYANSTVDSLLQKVREETDTTKKYAILQEIEDRISKEYPAAFTHTPDFLYIVPQNLRGVALSRIASPSDRFRGVVEWYRNSDSVWPLFKDLSFFRE